MSQVAASARAPAKTHVEPQGNGFGNSASWLYWSCLGSMFNLGAKKKRNTHFGNGSDWVKLGYLKSWDGFILEISLHYTKPILIKYGWLGLTLYILDHFGPCQGPTTPLCLSNGWGVDNRHQKGWLGQHCAVEEAGVLARHTGVQALNSLARQWNNLHDVIIYQCVKFDYIANIWKSLSKRGNRTIANWYLTKRYGVSPAKMETWLKPTKGMSRVRRTHSSDHRIKSCT
jgi:hypothetical protein